MKPEKITPEIARHWLESNIDNRPCKDNVIQRYAQSMKSGQWELNGETIKFSEDGILIDGQHRLRAVLQSGVTIHSYVIRDLPRKVFDTIDTGANRTISDLLSLQGEANNSTLGPALRLLYVEDQLGSILELDRRLARIITNRDLLETLQKHPDITKSVSFISGIKSISRYMSVPIASYCHYQFSKIQPYHADAFFIKLARATDVDDDSPVIVLGRKLEGVSSASTAGRIECVALTIKAWNAYRKQRPVKVLRWSKPEEFPVAA